MILFQEMDSEASAVADKGAEDTYVADPDIEIFSDNSKHCKEQRTPEAAWILVCLLLLYTLINRANGSVLHEIVQLYNRQINRTSKNNKPYSRSLMIFCLTIAGYSARAYRFLREVSKNCIPAPDTLRKYRKRVDGSPGFSAAALQMIKNKVIELQVDARKLFVSISCDDMSIRQHIWFTGKN